MGSYTDPKYWTQIKTDNITIRLKISRYQVTIIYIGVISGIYVHWKKSWDFFSKLSHDFSQCMGSVRYIFEVPQESVHAQNIKGALLSYDKNMS